MQLKQIPRDALLKPLQAVSGIVERRHTLPILANVLLEHDGWPALRHRDRSRNADHGAFGIGRQGNSGDHGCRARKLQDLLRALPEDSLVTIDGTANRMSIRAGRSRFNLQALSAADYPRIGVGQDQVQALKLPQREFRGAPEVGGVRDGAARYPLLPERHVLVIDKGSLQAVATDGHRLSWASIAVRATTLARK
jgi:DNA polymerase-3 subunit beta